MRQPARAAPRATPVRAGRTGPRPPRMCVPAACRAARAGGRRPLPVQLNGALQESRAPARDALFDLERRPARRAGPMRRAPLRAAAQRRREGPGRDTTESRRHGGGTARAFPWNEPPGRQGQTTSHLDLTLAGRMRRFGKMPWKPSAPQPLGEDAAAFQSAALFKKRRLARRRPG